MAPVICLQCSTASSDLALLELFLFLKFKTALIYPKRTAIPSKTTGSVSGGFMEATRDMEGIMENTGNGSTEVVHFEGEEVVLAPFV